VITQEDKRRFEELIEKGDGSPRDKEALRIILRVVGDFFNDIHFIEEALRNGKR
jgi:hypothetical protein